MFDHADKIFICMIAFCSSAMLCFGIAGNCMLYLRRRMKGGIRNTIYAFKLRIDDEVYTLYSSNEPMMI